MTGIARVEVAVAEAVVSGATGSRSGWDSGSGRGDVEDFRRELRAWLAAHHPGPMPRRRDERFDFLRAWARTLADGGWAAPAWPARWGGRDATPEQQIAYHEELARARVPRSPASLGISLVGPVLIRHGSPQQQERFLPAMLRADEIWCQGFSEPDAGSDLPSLRTRGVETEQGYVVSGHKVWTTMAHVADWMFALVRTQPGTTRQEGISCLVVDMHATGVTVAPIRQLTGDAEFSEVFLDEVEVPSEHLVGEAGAGWGIARTTLGFERATAFVAQQIRYVDIVDQLLELARRRDVSASTRQRVVQLWIDVRISRASARRGLDEALRHGQPGPRAAVNRLMMSLFEQRLHEVAVEVLGPQGLLVKGDPDAVQRGRWVHGFLRTRASTIGSGTAEIQRNTIAERVLGLPPDRVAGS